MQVVDGHYEVLLNDLRNGRLDFLFGVLRRPDWVSDVGEEPLFLNQYVVVARKGHPLAVQKTLSLHDLLRYDWIMPGPSTPRQQALERLFVGMAEQPRIGIETTAMQIYRAILASTDRLTLMSRAESQLNDNSALTVLPFQSLHLSRIDGVATRVDWQPTSIHRQFLDLLRKQGQSVGARCKQSAGKGRSLANSQRVWPKTCATEILPTNQAIGSNAHSVTVAAILNDQSKPTIIVEDDVWARLIGVVLDPTTSGERWTAFADFMSPDLPDFRGWCDKVQKAAGSLYPSDVKLVKSQAELRESLGPAEAIVVESLTDRC